MSHQSALKRVLKIDFNCESQCDLSNDSPLTSDFGLSRSSLNADSKVWLTNSMRVESPFLNIFDTLYFDMSITLSQACCPVVLLWNIFWETVAKLSLFLVLFVRIYRACELVLFLQQKYDAVSLTHLGAPWNIMACILLHMLIANY